jgi:hypothetical protein
MVADNIKRLRAVLGQIHMGAAEFEDILKERADCGIVVSNEY